MKMCEKCSGCGEDFDSETGEVIPCPACNGTGDEEAKAAPKKAAPKKAAPKAEEPDVEETLEEGASEDAEVEVEDAEVEDAEVEEIVEEKPKKTTRKAPAKKAAPKKVEKEEQSTALVVASDMGSFAAIFARPEEVTDVIPAGVFAGHLSTITDAQQGSLFPRIEISQPLSSAVTDGRIPQGVFFRSDTGESLGKQLQFVPLAIVGQRIYYAEELGQILCAAFGSMAAPDFGEKFCERCRECEHQEWGEDNTPPDCSPLQTVLALVQDESGNDPFLATIAHRRTQLAVVKKELIGPLQALAARYHAPTYATRWAAVIEGKKGKKGAYFSRKYYQVPGLLTEAGPLAQLKKLVEENLPILRSSAGAEGVGADPVSNEF